MTVDRIRTFRSAFRLAAAERRVPTPNGIGLLAGSTPDVYDANYLLVDDPLADLDAAAAEAETVLEAHHHRRIVVDAGSDAAAAALVRHGYQLSTHLVLAHTREPDRRVDTSMVREVAFDELVPARTAATLEEAWGNEEIARQLNDAKRAVMRAVPTRFFAAHAEGEIAAYCELRSAGGVAQIEDVEALHAYRGRGLGRAIVQHALDIARADNEIVFLEALADDWPRLLYAKLGFDQVDRCDFLTKFPHPLTRVRVRTPRLELRLATVAELRRLYEVAAGGIHDPSFMPFEFAWTDDLNEHDFLAYHAGRLAELTPERWELGLVAFQDGAPVGVQAISAKEFASSRTVTTGSWLGRPYQGRGLGTEMRAGALTLAFDGLGATTARSGAISGNAQSLAVSRKLGYELVGSHTVSPRGEPLPHADLELARERFRSPVEVEIEGLEGLLPLFGA